MKLLHGDCFEELKKLPDGSVDLLLTDPPYGDDTPYGMSKRTIVNNESPLVGLYALHLSTLVPLDRQHRGMTMPSCGLGLDAPAGPFPWTLG